MKEPWEDSCCCFTEGSFSVFATKSTCLESPLAPLKWLQQHCSCFYSEAFPNPLLLNHAILTVTVRFKTRVTDSQLKRAIRDETRRHCSQLKNIVTLSALDFFYLDWTWEPIHWWAPWKKVMAQKHSDYLYVFATDSFVWNSIDTMWWGTDSGYPLSLGPG